MKYKKIIPLMIALLGFATACEKDDDGNGSRNTEEYGVPYAEFEQKSNVPQENTLSESNHIEK